MGWEMPQGQVQVQSRLARGAGDSVLIHINKRREILYVFSQLVASKEGQQLLRSE
jgi:hypothetical protein